MLEIINDMPSTVIWRLWGPGLLPNCSMYLDFIQMSASLLLPSSSSLGRYYASSTSGEKVFVSSQPLMHWRICIHLWLWNEWLSEMLWPSEALVTSAYRSLGCHQFKGVFVAHLSQMARKDRGRISQHSMISLKHGAQHGHPHLKNVFKTFRPWSHFRCFRFQ